MSDDSMYISTHEAALALVATAMKKARLRFDTLVINSLMGGILFATGGLFHVALQAHLAETFETNPGYVILLQAAAYPIGLFYVVIMGTELFNSNILFFSVALMRGAVSIIDLSISWIVSWWFNLASTIFVCYIFAHFSTIYRTEEMVIASRDIVDLKVSFAFHETLIKGMAGNFFVCMAVYLQIMAKPLHVKFFLMFLPIFTFVGLGFTHVVADMSVLIVGLINGSEHSVGTVAWKVFLPGTIGNIIGGMFFGIMIPWYSHLYTVEQDQTLLNLPRYEMRDEQPEINADSRVIKSVSRNDEYDEPEQEEVMLEKPHSSDSSSSGQATKSPPTGIYANEEDNEDAASRTSARYSASTANSLRLVRSRTDSHYGRSPKNVFPVYGMGEPLDRERSIASGRFDQDEHRPRTSTTEPDLTGEDDRSAEFVGDRLKKYISRKQSSNTVPIDLEKQPYPPPVRSPTFTRSINQLSVSSQRSRRSNSAAYRERMVNAGITPAAMRNSDNVAGSHRSPPSASSFDSFYMRRAASDISPTNSTEDIQQFEPER